MIGKSISLRGAPDAHIQAIRIFRAIERMVAGYQNEGEYLDLDGQTCSDASGIIRAWEELDSYKGKPPMERNEK